MSDKAPHSPSQSVASEAETNVSSSSKAVGALCVLFSLIILLPGVFQLLSALIVVGAALNSSNSNDTAHAIGGVFGASIMVIIGWWIFRFGLSKIRTGEGKS